MEIWYMEDRGYYRNGARYLHRVVYEEEYGPIPDGCVIHHIDGDMRNNVPDNLEMITQSEHCAEHWRRRPAQYGICETCGQEYTYRATSSFFCGPRCYDRSRDRSGR